MFERDGMKGVRYLCAILLVFPWLMFPSIVVAETWPIKRFHVVQTNQEPQSGTVDMLLYGAPVNREYITLAQAAAIEVWLEKVAAYFEQQGWPPPRYGHKSSDNEKYLVYVYPFGGATDPPAAASNDCENQQRSTYIKIDPDRIFDKTTGKLLPKSYQDLAHELFHTIQYAYPLFQRSCHQMPGAWIVEGTAEAVGIETARELKGIQPQGVCQMGIRRYGRELYVREDRTFKDQCGNRSYLTQSFWQFLGEYSTRKGFIATEEFAKPDFRYLQNFFRTNHVMGVRSKEYVWLDKVLHQVKRYGKHQFGISLHTAYSRFVGSFSSYWKPKRRNLYPGGSSSNLGTGEKTWIEGIFSKCMEVLVTQDATSTFTLPIEPHSARCIKLNYGFSGRVGLTFYASSLSETIELEALAISTNGGKKIIRRHPAEQVDDKIGKFSNITAKAGTPRYFIVSNVQRKNPGKTTAIAPTFTIVPEIATTDMAKEKKEPDPSPDPTEKEERETAGKSRSWKGKVWQRKGRPCKRPFEAAPCGPISDIGLTLLPDTAFLAEELAQPSVSGERKFRLFDDIVQEGSESFVSEMMDDYMAINQQDGGSVDITIPQIQPGFTGVISHAHINVSKAIGDKGNYRAIGPWVGSCKDGYRPSTGTVTIEEFSKYILRGTFSAKLVDTEGLKPCQSGSVSKTNDGSFSITEIDWNLGSDSPQLDDEAIIDDVIDDSNSIIPGLITDDLREAAKERARKRRQEKNQAKQEKAKGTGDVTKQCKCTCKNESKYCKENSESSCCKFCDPIFKVCKGTFQTHSAPLTAEEQAKEDAEVQAMRQRYKAYVDSLPAPHEVRKQMMDAFDNMKTVDQKRLLMMALPR